MTYYRRKRTELRTGVTMGPGTGVVTCVCARALSVGYVAQTGQNIQHLTIIFYREIILFQRGVVCAHTLPP